MIIILAVVRGLARGAAVAMAVAADMMIEEIIMDVDVILMTIQDEDTIQEVMIVNHMIDIEIGKHDITMASSDLKIFYRSPPRGYGSYPTDYPSYGSRDPYIDRYGPPRDPYYDRYGPPENRYAPPPPRDYDRYGPPPPR